MPLDARLEAQKLKELYRESPYQHKYNLLLLGDPGTGKTFFSTTCRKPVHIDSFDKGGTKALWPWIEKDEIIVNPIYERENPLEPFAYREWKSNFLHLVNDGYFEKIGTYFLDSNTFWNEAIMNWVLKNAKEGGKVVSRAGEAPNYFKDYMPQKIEIRNALSQVLNLPCDVVVTGHLTERYDESRGDSGEVIKRLLGYEFKITGDAATIIPGMFDEWYISMTKDTPQGPEYQLLTSKARYYKARTRIGAGKFAQYEKADMKTLLRKIGWDTKDKALLSEEKKSK